MMTKFNKDMYARMRNKKDEPLFAIGTKSVPITDRGAPILAVLPSAQPSWQRGWRHQPCQSKSLLPVIRGWGLGTSRRRRLTPGLLVSRMTLEFPWHEPKTSLAQTTWRYSRGCQQMMLRGVIFISSFRYLCNFTLCLSFPSVLYIYIYIYLLSPFFFLGVRRESPSYFRVSGLRG